MSELPAGNPFSSRHVQPGAIDYLFVGESSTGRLVARLRQNGWWGSILGAHGSGKTTLLCSLLEPLAQANRQVVSFRLHEGQTRLPVTTQEVRTWQAQTLVIVDGYEQLNWFARWRLRRWCRRSGCGLLVTAHQDVGLPVLYQTAPSLDDLRRIVDRLLPEPSPIDDQDVQRCFARHPGNVREMLFCLYDVYEQKRN